MSLRAKITLAFFIISSLVSVGLALSTYVILNRSLGDELKHRVRNLATLGALLVDAGDLETLVTALEQTTDPVALRALEGSPQYARISSQLNAVRATEPDIVSYVYVFKPTVDRNTARYVVDADVLALRASGAEEEEISAPGSVLDLAEFPVARRAIEEAAPFVEDEFSYDREFDVRSITGYAPILSPETGGLVAVLGVDMVDTDVRVVLRRTTLVGGVTALVAVLLALGSSLALGTFLTRGIIALDRVVKRFAGRELEVRADVTSRDEVGRLGLSFNQMAEMIQRHNRQLERLLKAYGRFVPHHFLKFLSKESILDVELGDQVQKEMTVLFSDIRSFTALSEAMTPAENFNFLNSYLSRMGPEIRTHNGFIDKYIGDAIMALFPDRPEDAVDAAVAMRERLREYNAHRQSMSYPPISTGIAVHTGKLMLGTLGEHERMDGSVIADAVNLCSRLESMSRHYGDTILITGVTLSQIGRGYGTRFVDRVRVRGRNEAVLIYEVYDGDLEEQRVLKAQTRARWTEALTHYYDREFKEAYRILSELRKVNPHDVAVELYLRRVIPLVRNGAPEGWDGVQVVADK